MEAGTYLILTENLSGFAEGRLSNDGERLELRDAQGVLIDVVEYGVGFPWPLSLNGRNDWPFGTGVPDTVGTAPAERSAASE